MQSVILLGKNREKNQEYVQAFCQEEHIDTFDQTVIDTEASVGIELVRTMQKTVHLKPFRSEKKIIIINNAEKLTSEAQNALLKILEEPPINTFIFLIATTTQHFLPTILSRCTLIKLEETEKLSQETLDEFFTQFQKIYEGSIGDKLFFAEKIAEKKEEINTWFETTIASLREKMIKETKQTQQSELAKNILFLQKVFQTSKNTNVNNRFLLENLFLSL